MSFQNAYLNSVMDDLRARSRLWRNFWSPFPL